MILLPCVLTKQNTLIIVIKSLNALQIPIPCKNQLCQLCNLFVLLDRLDSDLFPSIQSYQDQAEKIGFSGPLLLKMHTVDELLERNERHIRRTVRRSWFHRGTLHSKTIVSEAF
jgi:hypothetical protein